MTIKSKVNQQKVLALTICALISYNPIVTFVNSIFNLFVNKGFIYDTLVIYIILLTLILKSLSFIIKKIKKDVILFILLLLTIFLVSYLFFPENRSFMFSELSDVLGNPFYILFIFSFPGYIFTRYITNYDILNENMRKTSLLVVVCSILTLLIHVDRGGVPQYMVFSYDMTAQTLFLILMSIEKKKMLDLVIGLVGCIMIILAGARGPVLCILLVFTIYLGVKKTSALKKVGLMTLLFMVIGIIFIYFHDILYFLINISDKLGINSRTLQFILNNSIFDDSGRSIIIENIIKSYSVLGLGVYGDRVVSGGDYAHNFFIEIMAQFGYFLGPLIIVVVILITLNGVLSRNYNIRNLAIIFLSTGFIKLLLSGSYLNQEPAFYILLALGVNSICLRRGKKDEDLVVMQHNVTQNSRRFIKTCE